MDFPSPSKRKVFSVNDFPQVSEQRSSGIEYNSQRFSESAFIIDNGSSLFRAGWSHDPMYKVSFVPYVGRTRGNVTIGDGIYDTKDKLKTPFHQDVVYASKPLEDMLDYTFNTFSLKGESIPHPIFITEPPLSPSFSRSLTNELLFECYQVPRVFYSIDSLCSFYNNTKTARSVQPRRLPPAPGSSGSSQYSLACPQDGLIIRSGLQRTQVLPILGGKVIYEKSRSTPIGGHHISQYLLELLRLKYPQHATDGYLSSNKNFPLHEMEGIKKSLCHVSTDYFNEIKMLSQNKSYFHKKTIFANLATNNDEEEDEESNSRVVPPPPASNLTPEEIEAKKRRRQENMQKMKKKQTEMYEERVKKELEDLQYFEHLMSLKTQPDKREVFQTELQRIGFTESDLTQSYNTLKKKIKNRKKREESKLKRKKKKKESPIFPQNIENSTLTFTNPNGSSNSSDIVGQGIVPSNLLNIQPPPQQQQEQPPKKEESITKKRKREVDADYNDGDDVIVVEEPRKKKTRSHSVLYDENLKVSNPEKWLEEVRKLRSEVFSEILDLGTPSTTTTTTTTKQQQLFEQQNGSGRVKKGRGRRGSKKKSSNNLLTVSMRRTKRKAASRGRLKQITQAILNSQKLGDEGLKKSRKKKKKKKGGKGMELLKQRRRRKKKGKKGDRQFYASDSDEDDDLFGLNDDDWNIYRQMNKQIDEEGLEKRKERTNVVNEKRQYLGEIDIAIANTEMKLYNKSMNQANLNHYMRQYQHLRVFGMGNQDYMIDALNAQLREEERYQMHLTVERIRAPELLFSPNFVGKRCCGLRELLELVLKSFSNIEDVKRMVSHVYLSGGNMMFRGMKRRIGMELRSFLPTELYNSVQVYGEASSEEDAWKGMRGFYNDTPNEVFRQLAVSKAEYEEEGFLRTHIIKNGCWLSNLYLEHQNIPVLVHQQPNQPQQQQPNGVIGNNENNIVLEDLR